MILRAILFFALLLGTLINSAYSQQSAEVIGNKTYDAGDGYSLRLLKDEKGNRAVAMRFPDACLKSKSTYIACTKVAIKKSFRDEDILSDIQVDRDLDGDSYAYFMAKINGVAKRMVIFGVVNENKVPIGVGFSPFGEWRKPSRRVDLPIA